MTRKKRVLYYGIYTLLFSILAGMVVYFYYSQGKSLIESNGDGFRQHFRSVVYYSEYLKGIFRNLFINGKLVIPQWDFVIGDGSDILTALHYYCIGDIFTFFSFLCPKKYLYLYFDGATIARLFFSGVTFSELCFYKKKKAYSVIMASSMLYAFCPLSLPNIGGHVFFLSAVVYLPLIIVGVEKILNDDRPYFLSFSVFLSCTSNIYFFYMNVLSTIVFVLVRIIFLDKNVKEKIRYLLTVTLYSFIGVLLSSFIFLPMFNVLISNTRLETKIDTGFFYPLANYLGYYTHLSFNGYLNYGGFTLVGLISLVSLYRKKYKSELSLLFIIFSIFSLFPFFGKLYNAMVYPTERWLYAVSLLVSYIIVDRFDDVDKNDVNIAILGLLVVYYLSCIALDKGEWKVYAMFLLIAIITYCIYKKCDKKTIALYCSFVIIFSVLFDIMYYYSPFFWNFAEGGTEISKINNIDMNEFSVFDSLNDNSFYRYSGDLLETNESIHGKKSSTQYYWSVVNDNIVKFRKELGLSDNSNHHYSNYDERFALNALAGVKYYIHNDGGLLPYGFVYQDTVNGYSLYHSENNQSLVYAYDNFIHKEEWDKLKPEEKNELLIQAAVVEKPVENIKQKAITFNNKEIQYTLDCSHGIVIDNGTIFSKEPNSSISLKCKNNEAGEYYLLVEGLYSDESAYLGINYDNTFKYIKFKGNDSLHFTDRHDYLINLGYMNGIDGDVTINFPIVGEFKYSSIRLIYQPLEEQILFNNKIKNISINDLIIDTNKVTAEVSLDDTKIVCFSIPFSKGWKASVDGKDIDLLDCNIQYMGMVLDKGSHNIILSYATPFLREGTIVSGIGALALFGLWLRNRKYNRISKNEKK